MLNMLSVAAALLGSAAILSAQAIDPDTFKVNYFVNANKAGYPDGTVEATNVGTDPAGHKALSLSADIYVFQNDVEMAECCCCTITPDGLLTLSVNANLTANPLTGVTLHSGIIKIVSSKTCQPTAPQPDAGIRAWGTHIQSVSAITETAFIDSGLSAVELASLGSQCSAIQLVGSGKGVCTCPASLP
jgi:hypothetical protein